MSITKNDNGTLSIGSDIQIVSSYNKETKQHTFTFMKDGCAHVHHVGNHLTLRNNLHKLVEELLSTETEQIPAEPTAEVESDEVENFKELINKFDNSTGEERIAIASEMRLFYIRVKLSELFMEFQNTTGAARLKISEDISEILKLRDLQNILETEETEEAQELEAV